MEVTRLFCGKVLQALKALWINRPSCTIGQIHCRPAGKSGGCKISSQESRLQSLLVSRQTVLLEPNSNY